MELWSKDFVFFWTCVKFIVLTSWSKTSPKYEYFDSLVSLLVTATTGKNCNKNVTREFQTLRRIDISNLTLPVDPKVSLNSHAGHITRKANKLKEILDEYPMLPSNISEEVSLVKIHLQDAFRYLLQHL